MVGGENVVKRIRFITKNRSHRLLVPGGIVIHETATPGATAENEYSYFNSGDRNASVHGFIDWKEYIQTVPYDEVAWHAGYTANHQYIGIELCHAKTKEDFEKVWENAIEVVTGIMDLYGFAVSDLTTHDEVSRMWKETDHTDPTGYFKKFGKTFNDFKEAVNRRINGGLSMTQYEELKSITAKQEKTITELRNKLDKVDTYIYNYIDTNMPEWAHETIEKLVKKGFLQGNGNGLNLSNDMLRTLVILDRTGVFGE